MTARQAHTATRLNSGQVLVAGGSLDGSTELGGAELYDPKRGTWSATGSLVAGRLGHTATLLPSGKVLVVGGQAHVYGSLQTLTDAELYGPASGTWSTTGLLVTGRTGHTATVLPSGKVLVAGGYNYSGGITTYLNSAELYDPAAGAWSATGPLAAVRTSHTATLLSSGKVLVAGGLGPGTGTELYDPAAGTWSGTGSLVAGRMDHTATLLNSGQVLVAGGYYNGVYLSSAELYDPALGTWSATGSMWVARQWATATLLTSGRVLVAGGLEPAPWWGIRELPRQRGALLNSLISFIARRAWLSRDGNR